MDRATGVGRGPRRAGFPAAAWAARPSPSLFRALLEVAAEALAHRGQDAVAEVGLAAGGEPVEQRGGEHGRRYALLDRCLDRPSALARVAHVAGVLVELRRLVQRLSC